MQTAAELKAAGNVPTAIQRLMQLAGNVDLTPDERASVLDQLATLSAGPGGYNLSGAVGYYDEIIADYPGTEWARRAQSNLTDVQIKVESLNAVIASPDSTRMEQFDALMQLGRHEDAIDLMVSYSLELDNEPKLAMFQIGYLCDEPDLTGQVYNVIDRDGTSRALRFCDFGK